MTLKFTEINDGQTKGLSFAFRRKKERRMSAFIESSDLECFHNFTSKTFILDESQRNSICSKHKCSLNPIELEMKSSKMIHTSIDYSLGLFVRTIGILATKLAKSFPAMNCGHMGGENQQQQQQPQQHQHQHPQHQQQQPQQHEQQPPPVLGRDVCIMLFQWWSFEQLLIARTLCRNWRLWVDQLLCIRMGERWDLINALDENDGCSFAEVFFAIRGVTYNARLIRRYELSIEELARRYNQEYQELRSSVETINSEAGKLEGKLDQLKSLQEDGSVALQRRRADEEAIKVAEKRIDELQVLLAEIKGVVTEMEIVVPSPLDDLRVLTGDAPWMVGSKDDCTDCIMRPKDLWKPNEAFPTSPRLPVSSPSRREWLHIVRRYASELGACAQGLQTQYVSLKAHTVELSSMIQRMITIRQDIVVWCGIAEAGVSMFRALDRAVDVIFQRKNQLQSQVYSLESDISSWIQRGDSLLIPTNGKVLLDRFRTLTLGFAHSPLEDIAKRLVDLRRATVSLVTIEPIQWAVLNQSSIPSLELEESPFRGAVLQAPKVPMRMATISPPAIVQTVVQACK